jgi:tRNA (guanosine-2'-O-)-methyltransferase
MSRNLTPTELKRLHREWRRRAGAELSVVLDGVQSPFNVGALVRTAAALGVTEVWLAAGAPSPVTTAKVGKTALGAERFLTCTEVAAATEAIAANRARGRRVVGIELADDARALHETDLRGPVCLVFGHEDRGLAATTLAACDVLAFIPQLGRVGSLNVATAAGMALYEARRQGW